MDSLFHWIAEASGMAKGALIAIVASLLGRAMWHAHQVQRGRRRFWSWHLAWELPVALGMGLIADGAADWLELGGGPRAAFIAVVAYLGPHAIDEAFVSARDAARTRLGQDRK